MDPTFMRTFSNTKSSNRAAPSDSNEAGFTLIETSIALVVMMVAGLAVSSLFFYSIRFNSGASDRAVALSIGQQQMERLRKTPLTDTAFTDGTTTQTVTIGGLKYTVSTTICSTSTCDGSSSLKRITISVTPVAASSTWSKAPVTLISKRAILSLGPNY
jgi:Tfp pilus assembly protein PilV